MKELRFCRTCSSRSDANRDFPPSDVLIMEETLEGCFPCGLWLSILKESMLTG